MADKLSRTTSSGSSDRDSESFDDAPEASPRLGSRPEQSRSRSLLGKRDSSTAASTSRAGSPASATFAAAAGDKEKSVERPPGAVPATKPPPVNRVSPASDLDEVSLEEVGKKGDDTPNKDLAQDTRESTGSLQGLSGRMSPVKFPTPSAPTSAPTKATTAPPATSRKLTSPFSWLSRNNTSKKNEPTLPLANDRRNTNASVTTIGSNPDGTIDMSDIQSGQRSSQGNLRDRFKFLRMREEAGITMDNESVELAQGGAFAGLIGRTTSVGLGIGSPTSAAEDDSIAPRPILARRPTINPNLAPGTAAGIATGPDGDSAEPVDWDLWQTVVNEGPVAITRTSLEELNHAIACGIPQVIRGVIWQVLAQSKNDDLERTYRELVARGTDKENIIKRISHPSNKETNGITKEKESVASSSSSVHSDYSTPATTTTSTNAALSSPISDTAEDPSKAQAKLGIEKAQSAAAVAKLEKVIKRDLGTRTSYSKYLMASGLQDGLFGICKAYALYDEPVGYAQGMNFIAMPLLFNMPEEEAFCLFVAMMNNYGLRDLFVNDMAGLHLHLYQFERLLEEFEPALYCHLHRREVKPQLYATQWFLTLFAYRFPLQLVLRIYDLILSEGLESAILKFAIVLMQKNAETLLEMKDMAALTTFLKERIFDVYIDKAPSANSLLENGFFGSTAGVDKEVYRADVLVKDAVAVKITPAMIKVYTTEWKERRRMEKDREMELHGLRDKISTLETKVRVLESRAEQSDMEHVQVASELIKIKVENEGLADENETFKTKVEGLQKIVDTQGEEIEARLKSDMEMVMQKNITVHNENRALEEQMVDMEKELVATKMQWATMNEEHENLKQKWSSISQMMK